MTPIRRRWSEGFSMLHDAKCSFRRGGHPQGLCFILQPNTQTRVRFRVPPPFFFMLVIASSCGLMRVHAALINLHFFQKRRCFHP
jgi:hypothetical protein